MKWKELIKLMNRKRLLALLLVATATVATIFVSYAINRTTTEPTYNGNSVSFPINTDADLVVQGFDGTGSVTPPDGFTQFQLADNSQVRQGSGATGSTPTEPADSSGDDSSPTSNADADQVVHGSDSTSSDTSSDSSTPILIAENHYTEHDPDLQAYPNRNAFVQGADNTGSGSPATPDQPTPEEQPPSHVPEPATMLLLGSGLIGLAAFGRKLRKR